MKKPHLVIATVATAAAVAGLAAPAVAAPTDHHVGPAATSTLQRDADHLVRLGATGVLAEVDSPSGALQLRAGYGNLAKHTPVPWNARFRVASFTKTFTATVMLQLVGEGKVSLADTVDHWLPGLVRGNGNDGRKITVHELLQQTSGLPDYLANIPELFTTRGFLQHRLDDYRPADLVRIGMKSPSEFAPGTRWNYSNTNYVLAGMIIAKATGHSWQYEVEHRIVARLGLQHTYAPRTSSVIPGPNATGYERFPLLGSTSTDPKYGRQIDATRLNPSWAYSAGAIISTPEDGNRFLRALIQGKLLRPAQLREMTTTVATNDAFRAFWPGVRYGLGLMWIPNSCGGSWSHGGDIQGFMTRNGVSPDGRRSVVVSMNTDSPVPHQGVAAPKHEMTRTLIDHALCGA